MRNTDRRHSTEEVLEILRKFSQKLVDSGYDRGTRQEIVQSAIRKHYRELQSARDKGGSIYWRLTGRRKQVSS